MPDGAIKITMDKNLENAVDTSAPVDVSPDTEAPAVEETPTEEVSTSTDDTELADLLEKESGRGKPDPEKAKERFAKKHSSDDDGGADDDVDDEDRPMTRREAREYLAQQGHQTLVESNTERIIDYSNSISESDAEAEVIRAVHRNRVFPEGMSLREQINESHAIVNYKRSQAKALELARKVKANESASTNAASTHRDPQAGGGPKVSADLAASMKRSGFNLNNQTQRYEKTLPNGKTLVKVEGQSPFIVN